MAIVDPSDSATQRVRGIRYWLEDLAGTPLGLYIIAAPGQVSVTAGGHDTVYAMNENGDYDASAPRKGNQSGPSTVAFSGVRIRKPGGNLTVPALMDVLYRNSALSSAYSWTSDDAESEYVTFLLKWKTVDGSSAKGATYQLGQCTIQPGSTFNPSPEGVTATFTVQSPNAYPTITENP